MFSGLLIIASALAACETGSGEMPGPASGCTDCQSNPQSDGGKELPSEDASTDAAVDSGIGSQPESDAARPPPDASPDAGPYTLDASTPEDAGPYVPPTYPADLLDLTNWKLTVPVETDHQGTPDEYRNPELQTLSLAPHFTLSPDKDAVVFRAHAGGATTSSSSYPRSELREMTHGGSENAAWSTTSGVHRMKVTQAITHLTAVKPHVVSAQIHDAEDDVIMVRLQRSNLYVEGNGERVGTLDSNYKLGTRFTVEIVAANGMIEVFYNGASKVRLQRAAVACYFKAGCYTQTNVSRGEAPEDYAQVEIYELSVKHE